MQPRIYTVSEVNRYVKSLIEKDFILNEIYIKGEISNYKRHPSGHLYFTVKDENGAISAVMFKGNAIFLSFEPKNGMEVILNGYVTLYEKTGQYQFYAKKIDAYGIGAYFLAFEHLKEKLGGEGLFSLEHKRPLPNYPESIAVVTAETGAALQDILNIARRRNKTVRLLIVPVLVQGTNAPSSIVEGIKKANRSEADIIILARGGGSFEELMAFNDESVARAIYSSRIPLISAIGHETDYTISDFTADFRAPTPSAAAELCIPDLLELKHKMHKLNENLRLNMENYLKNKKYKIDIYKNSPAFRKPETFIVNNRLYLSHLVHTMNKEMRNKIERYHFRILNLNDKLNMVSPLKVLNRGYSITYDENGHIVKKPTDVAVGSRIAVRTYGGIIKAAVTEAGESVGS